MSAHHMNHTAIPYYLRVAIQRADPSCNCEDLEAAIDNAVEAIINEAVKRAVVKMRSATFPDDNASPPF